MKIFNSRTSRSGLLLMVAMLIALGIVGMGATPASAAHMIPFVGGYSGTAAFASDGTPRFRGTGIATYLGKSTNEGYVVFTSGAPSCAGGVPNDQYETLTGANGDSITIVSHDVACPIGPSQYHGTGNWQVVGGTGRFNGATGEGTLDGKSDFSKGTFGFVVIGKISVPSEK
jgi:hypothetical protein